MSWMISTAKRIGIICAMRCGNLGNQKAILVIVADRLQSHQRATRKLRPNLSKSIFRFLVEQPTGHGE